MPAPAVGAAAPAACCSPLTGGVLDEDAAKRLTRVFRALGDRHRVRLLSLIAAADGGEACICDLTAPVGLAQPAISHHMKRLASSPASSAASGPTTASSPDSVGALGGMLRVLFPDSRVPR